MSKRKRKAAKRMTGMVLFAMLVIMAALLLEQQEERTSLDSSQKPAVHAVSDEVLEYEPLVAKYATKYGIQAHQDVLLAMMMQESGGRGGDPMQSSESYCGKRNCIRNPETSIKQGTAYFARSLEESGGDLKLAVQSYNFGRGFIAYAKAHGGRYSEETALAFSRKKYQEAADPSKFRCLRKAAREQKACYGDIYYVRSVMKYREAFAGK